MSSITGSDAGVADGPKFAVQTVLLPGETLKEQFSNAAAFGFDAVEVNAGPAFDVIDRATELRHAIDESGLPVSAICTHPIHDPFEGDTEERKRRLGVLKDYLAVADELGIGGIVSVPVRSRDRLADVESRRQAVADLDQELLETYSSWVGDLPAGDARLYLEPLNRYETWYLNSVGHATDLARRINSPRVRSLADLFHMNIEEADFAEPIIAAGKWLGHVHLADNNRLEPGAGCMDFEPFFRGLQQAGYTGYMTLECFSPDGPLLSDTASLVLPESVNVLRRAWNSALGHH